MKAVLVGSDLMYRKDGSLAPIEINTNVGWDEPNRVESEDEIFDVADLVNYVTTHDITEVVFLPGTAGKFLRLLKEALPDITVRRPEKYEEVEDLKNRLIIRTHYSDEALVDSFCRDKIDFLKSLKGTNLEVEYLLKTEDGFEGEITSVETGYPAGVPNFILKYRYPNYDKGEYPKLYRFESIEDLVDFAEEMPEDFFLMPYYFCENELWEGRRIQMIRDWNLFIANEEGGLDSVEVGKYTKLCDTLDLEAVEYGDFELEESLRGMFLTTGWYNNDSSEMALLDEGDLVWMADGSWKKVEDLREGDKVKSLEVPAKKNGFSTKFHIGNYGVSLEQLEQETFYVENEVKKIKKLNRFDNIVKFTFTDGTDWYDTGYSSYPTVNSRDQVEFKTLKMIKEGSKVVLVNIEDTENPKFEVKEVAKIKTERKLLEGGYTVELDNSHLFISRTQEDAQAYAAIEHNDTWRTACNVVAIVEGEPVSGDNYEAAISGSNATFSVTLDPNYSHPTGSLSVITNALIPADGEQIDIESGDGEWSYDTANCTYVWEKYTNQFGTLRTVNDDAAVCTSNHSWNAGSSTAYVTAGGSEIWSGAPGWKTLLVYTVMVYSVK